MIFLVVYLFSANRENHIDQMYGSFTVSGAIAKRIYDQNAHRSITMNISKSRKCLFFT